MCELALLPARVSSISNFSTSLLKCLSKVSASSSLLLIVIIQNNRFFVKSLLGKKRTDIFPIARDNSMVWFPKKPFLVLWINLTQKFLWRLKRLLDSSFLVLKNLFLSFDLFTISLLSSLVIKLQFFERIERACQEQITQCY